MEYIFSLEVTLCTGQCQVVNIFCHIVLPDKKNRRFLKMPISESYRFAGTFISQSRCQSVSRYVNDRPYCVNVCTMFQTTLYKKKRHEFIYFLDIKFRFLFFQNPNTQDQMVKFFMKRKKRVSNFQNEAYALHLYTPPVRLASILNRVVKCKKNIYYLWQPKPG